MEHLKLWMWVMVVLNLPLLLLTKFHPGPFALGTMLVLSVIGTARVIDDCTGSSPESWPSSGSSSPPPPPMQPYSQDLHDKRGNYMGRIVSRGDHTEIHNRTGDYLGYYDANTNCTYDKAGNMVAQCNVLTTLL